MDSQETFIDAFKEQYGAAFAMLENIIKNCDEQLWQDTNREIIISQVVYHTQFFIDYYLAKDDSEKENFKPKLGDDRMGERTDGEKWDKTYTREELLNYFAELRKKAEVFFDSLTLDMLSQASLFDWHGSSRLSSLIYNLRHIMLHVGALHVRLNAVGKEPMKWVSKAPIL